MSETTHIGTDPAGPRGEHVVRILHVNIGQIYYVTEDTMSDLESGKSLAVNNDIVLDYRCVGRGGDGFHISFHSRGE